MKTSQKLFSMETTVTAQHFNEHIRQWDMMTVFENEVNANNFFSKKLDKGADVPIKIYILNDASFPLVIEIGNLVHTYSWDSEHTPAELTVFMQFFDMHEMPAGNQINMSVGEPDKSRGFGYDALRFIDILRHVDDNAFIAAAFMVNNKLYCYSINWVVGSYTIKLDQVGYLLEWDYEINSITKSSINQVSKLFTANAELVCSAFLGPEA